jgi:hypothetical protein
MCVSRVVLVGCDGLVGGEEKKKKKKKKVPPFDLRKVRGRGSPNFILNKMTSSVQK